MEKTYHIQNEPELIKVLNDIEMYLNRPTVVLLSGELGAGKTTFTKIVADFLHVKQPVTSPTFLLHKSYKLPKTKMTLEHYDFYRLSQNADLDEIGFNETLVSNNIIIIEWPQKISNLKKYIKAVSPNRKVIDIHFQHLHKENERNIKLKY